ncbi:MAG: hypothetical protein AB7V50_02515 [Vampirovibrionia bacterium]
MFKILNAQRDAGISSHLNLNKQLVNQVSFTGYKEFVDQMSDGSMPKDSSEMKGKIGASFPLLYSKLPVKDAVAIFEAMQKGNETGGKSGFTNFLVSASQGISAGERVGFINALQESMEEVRKNLPLGTIEKKDGNVTITSFDNDKGKAATITFDESKRGNKVFGPQDISLEDFIKDAFPERQTLKICPVGWTVPDVEVLYENNKSFKELIDDIEKTLLTKMGVGKDNADFQTKFAKAKKQVAGSLYESAFKQFWAPIDNAIFEDQESTIYNRNQLGFVTSSSYAGIDKAAMDYAKEYNIPVANITPFKYAEWSDKGDNAPYPMYVTNTVDDYANACAEAADILLVTGGRDHTFNKDIKNMLIEQNKVVIPVDIMKEVFAYEIPAISRGKVANAAALMIDKGMDIGKLDISKNIIPSTKLTTTQNQVATAIKTMLKQKTQVNPDDVVSKLIG